MSSNPFHDNRRLTDSAVRELVGAWLTECRLHPRKPGDPIPQIVRRAFKRFSAIRAVTRTELQGYAANARQSRLKKHPYPSTLRRLEKFDTNLVPEGGRLVIKITKTKRPKKNAWPTVHLELPAAQPGYVLRYKATRYGYFHSLAKKGSRPNGTQPLATFGWQQLPANVLPSLHPAARAFFEALKPPPPLV